MVEGGIVEPGSHFVVALGCTEYPKGKFQETGIVFKVILYDPYELPRSVLY